MPTIYERLELLDWFLKHLKINDEQIELSINKYIYDEYGYPFTDPIFKKHYETLLKILYKNQAVLIEDLGFSSLTRNALMRSGMRTIHDICACSETVLRRIRNIGSKCIKEIKEVLKSKGYILAKY